MCWIQRRENVDQAKREMLQTRVVQRVHLGTEEACLLS